ncbi:MAG: MoaD/ThiS family protein [Bacillota bacterium]|jgi:molybdopterin converting factor small subunit
MLRITLQTRGYLQQVFPDKKDTVVVEVERPEAVRALIARLNIHPDLVMVVLSGDGQRRDLDYVPGDGEVVTILPPISGG